MKRILFILIAAGLLSGMTDPATAQIKDPVKTAEKKGEQRVNRGIDRVIDKGFDKVEEGIGGLFKKKTKKESTNTDAEAEEAGETNADGIGRGESGPALSWAKYDFVPGDKVIFEDNLEGEENGEFPSRWISTTGVSRWLPWMEKMSLCSESMAPLSSLILRIRARTTFLISSQ